MKFKINNEKSTFNICRSMKQSGEVQLLCTITHRIDSVSEVQIEERLDVESLEAIMMNLKINSIKYYDEWVATLEKFEYRSKLKRTELDMNRESPPARPYIEEAPKLELKDRPPHLRYVFLGRNETLPVVIAADLNGRQVER